MSNIVQYIVVRSDLRSALSWPLGAVIAQSCHATAAVIHLNSEDADTVAYLNDLDNMHKVVLEVMKWVYILNNVYHRTSTTLYFSKS